LRWPPTPTKRRS